MRKPDYAHKMTDAELAKLEQRIAKLYKEAADELTDTVKAYFEQFEKRDAAMREKLDAGEITEQQYTQKFKSIDDITKAKEKNNEKYRAKTGNDWSFNTDGRATAYHEFGHCVVDVRGLPDNWESISSAWAEESKCDILKTPDEAFAEAWAAYHLGDEKLPQNIAEIIQKIAEGK